MIKKIAIILGVMIGWTLALTLIAFGISYLNEIGLFKYILWIVVPILLFKIIINLNKHYNV